MKMLLRLLYLFLLSGSVLCHEDCSYPSIIKQLGLTSNKDQFTLSRPKKNPSEPLEVKLDFKLEAILKVHEADQMFTSYTSTEISWYNDYINPMVLENCSIERITVPSALLWKPDLTIYEEMEKDTSSQSSFLVIDENGAVHMKKDQVIVSMCKMDMYKFPFDTQRCNLSFKSFIHTSDEIHLTKLGSDDTITETILDLRRAQYEWLFQDVKGIKKTEFAFNNKQDMIVYMISMKRRSVLYVVNFILPVLFFLSLDYATFLMADGGGDKLGFKITILLAVTVLQLLLNEILPSSSESIPLIAVFCIGVFSLMALSLFQTIVVMHLLDRDSKCLNRCTEKTEQENGLKCLSWFKCLQKNLSDDLLSEHTTDKEERSGSRLDGSDVDRLLQELRHMCAVLSEAEGGSKEDGYWSSRMYIINRVFLLFYSTCTALFLAIIFYHWLNETSHAPTV